jgi:hypothetical protein
MHIPFLHGQVSGVQFTPGFSELPALSFEDTPLGMGVASTRFAKGRLWVRTADVILPNVAQYPIAYETGEAERSVLGAWATRWIVPIDDANSWVVGFRHFNPVSDPNGHGRKDDVGMEKVDFAGQTAAPAARRQRNPGDYEAMVGQGPIAIHANEHLMVSDRGVLMLRKMLRKGIAAVRDGRPLDVPSRDLRGTLPTYTYEAVFPWPGAEDPPGLGKIGDLVLRALIDSATEPAEARARAVAARIREIRCR